MKKEAAAYTHLPPSSRLNNPTNLTPPDLKVCHHQHAKGGVEVSTCAVGRRILTPVSDTLRDPAPYYRTLFKK